MKPPGTRPTLITIARQNFHVVLMASSETVSNFAIVAPNNTATFFRYLIFLTSSGTSADSGDLGEARKPLDAIGVKTIAVGIDKDVDPLFLQKLASENQFVFVSQSADELPNIRSQVTKTFCDGKSYVYHYIGLELQ